MSVITKDQAKTIANKLTAEKAEAIEKAKNDFSRAVMLAFAKLTPTAVKKWAKLHPDYFKREIGVYLNGNGWSTKYVRFPEKIIVKYCGNSTPYWAPEGEANKALTKMHHAIENMEEAYKTLKLEIASTLLALKTHKRIEEQFNEAFQLIPDKVVTALAINVEDIRKRL